MRRWQLRPPVVDRELHADLVALLAFRHFFRHAYGIELDPARVRMELERLVRVEPKVETALVRFDGYLAQAEKDASG